MKQELSKTNLTKGPPGPMPPTLEVALSSGLVALDSGLLNRETVPGTALIALKDRRQELYASLTPASRQFIARVLGSLSGMSSASVTDEDELEALLRQDIEDLADVSAWALEAAARSYRRGEIGDGKWRPTAGQLRKEARRLEIAARAELYKIGRLLDSPAISAPRPSYVPRSEVEAIHQRIAEFAKGMGA